MMRICKKLIFLVIFLEINVSGSKSNVIYSILIKLDRSIWNEERKVFFCEVI